MEEGFWADRDRGGAMAGPASVRESQTVPPRRVGNRCMPAFRQHGMLVYFAPFKKHSGLYPPGVWRQGSGESSRTLRRAEGQSSVSAGSADSLRLDRTDREAASQTGLRKGGGKAIEAEAGLDNGHHRQA